MRITDLREGEYCTRDAWGHSTNLCIGLIDGNLLYFYGGSLNKSGGKVCCDSTAYNYDNFRLCNRFAKSIKKIKENKMKYEDAGIIVVSSVKPSAKVCKTEDDAFEYIEDTMEEYPRAKFKMYKPYQKIEPKKSAIRELIQKIGLN